jgi:hypothetical protein
MIAGEIHELKQELNALERGKKKEAVKKVIAGKQSALTSMSHTVCRIGPFPTVIPPQILQL